MQYAREIMSAKCDVDFPEIAKLSLPTPFHVRGAIDHDVMKQQLIYGVAQLKKLDVDFIVVPCNVVHQYFEVLGFNESHEPLRVSQNFVCVDSADQLAKHTILRFQALKACMVFSS